MNKNYYALLFVIFLTLIIDSQPAFCQTAPPFEWARNCSAYYNGTTTYANYGNGICIDENANNYTIGYFNGTIYFDTCTLSAVNPNYFIVSYDSSGSFRWVKQIKGMGGNISSQDIVYDYAGHIYTTGVFTDSISFDGINYFSTSQPNSHFLARFDTSGNFQWVKIFQPKAPNSWFSYIHLDCDNGHNIYTIEHYTDTLKIDGNIMNVPSTDNFYFAKFDSSGVMQFIRSGFATGIYNFRITHDVQSNIYITGGPMNGTVSIQAGNVTGKGMFIAGFDSSGNYKWMNFATGNTVYGSAIQIVNNSLYIAGFYNDSMQIGSSAFYTPTLTHNTFLAQYDTTGTFNWAKRIDVGTGNQIRINSMIASNNYVYVAGEFTRTLFFNGIQYTSTNNVSRDPYVAAYDNVGNELWFKSAGSFHEDYGYDIDIDANQNLYLTGSTHFPSYFDSIMLTDSITSPTLNPTDTYIAKIDNNSVLSIRNISQSTQVLVYPNPLTSETKITFHNSRKQKFNFTLTDITGQTVETFSTEQSEIILTKGIKATGVYLFNLVNGQTGELINGKIVIAD